MKPGQSKFTVTIDIAKHIFKMDGIAGFYRGYWASLSAYVPNSALWWGFYHLYQGILYIYILLLLFIFILRSKQ